MTRFALAVAVLLAAAGNAFAQSIDAPPSTPAGLSASVYSSSAGAIRWQRSTDDAGFVPGYEVARDGTVLGVFDALSYVDRALSPGTAYRYTVTALDTAGQRSGVAQVTLLTQGDGPDAGGNTGGPAAPAGLRVDVYSATNGELFWTRPTTSGLTYEVRRNGAVVATTDGVSYYDDTLAAGTAYAYEVVAIDRDGTRSAPSRIELTTPGGGGSAGTTLAAPTGLRAVVYSATAGAVAWERPNTFGLVYEVSRDGQLVATTDGTSYVDDTLAAGTTYDYEVIALDQQGERSAASLVGLTTPGGDGGVGSRSSIISVDNRETVLENVLATIGAEVYRPTYERIENVLLGEEGRTVISEQIDEEGARVTVAECADGGRTISAVSGGAQTLFVDIEIETCRIDGVTFDGRLTRDSVFADGAGTSRTADLTITEASGDVTTVSSESASSNPLLSSTDRFEVSRFESTGPDGPIIVEAARSATFRDNPIAGEPSQRAEFSARVSAPWTGGEPLEIRTEEPFAAAPPSLIDSNGTTYTSGVLVAEAADGSRLTLDMANGDPTSVTLMIEASDGTSAFTVPVRPDLQIPCTRSASDDSNDLLACSLDPGLPL